MLDAALSYAQRGLHVFPLHPGTKKPIQQGGFANGTMDAEKIKAWWGACPDANIGWHLDASGLCAVDFDRGAPWLDMPLTQTISTPSGGEHLIFRGQIRTTQQILAEHVDTRGVGGYTLLPPSIIDERDEKAAKDPTRRGVYKWLDTRDPAPVPTEVVEELRPREYERTEKRIAELDTEERIAECYELASRFPPATNGKGSQQITMRYVNRLLDLCSQDIVFNALVTKWMPRCVGEWTDQWMHDRVYSTKPGCGRREEFGIGQVADKIVYPDPPPNANGSQSRRVILKNGGSSRVEKITWLWKDWLAQGKLHILAGCPGAGKSTLCFDLMARISNGGKWPDGTDAPAGDVLIWSGEDNFEDTILPRFIAAGGDRARLYCVSDVIEEEHKRAFDPSTDIHDLLGAVATLPNLRLVILDPIVNAVGAGKDSYKNAEVRRSLQPIVDFAEAKGVVLLGITHFTKGTEGRDPTERVTGSLAFGALARVVLAASADEEGETRRLVRAKSNIGPMGGGFEYQLQRKEIEGGIPAQFVDWGNPIYGAARALLGDSPVQKALEIAKEFLEEYLSGGLKYTRDVQEAATAHGITYATLRRAQTALRIKPKQNLGATHGGWYWELPPLDEPKK